MNNTLKIMKYLMLISGVLITILGITMLFTPLTNLVSLAIFIGVSVLISGISEIVSFCDQSKESHSGWLLASGIISVLFAPWIFFGGGIGILVGILPFIFATWMIGSSIMRIVGAFYLKSVGLSLWVWILILGVLGTIFGFTLLLTPILSAVIIAYLIAMAFISQGINNIIIFFCA